MRRLVQTCVVIGGLLVMSCGCAGQDRAAVDTAPESQSSAPVHDAPLTCVGPATVDPTSTTQVNGASAAGLSVGEFAQREYPDLFGGTYTEQVGGSLVITLTRCDPEVAERLIASTGLPRDLVTVRLVDLTATEVDVLFQRIALHSDISSVPGGRLVSVELDSTTNRVIVGMLNLTDEQRTALEAIDDDPHVDIVDVTEAELPRAALMSVPAVR